MKLHALFSSGLSAANASADGWTLVAPFGDFPFKDAQGREHLQVFNAENCAEMVTTFNGLWSKLSRVVGSMFGRHACPLWLGHPDFAPQVWKDRKQLGTVEGLRVSERGLEAQLAYNAEGEAVRAAGKHVFPSVSVECEPDEAGRIHPKLLWSIGLWHRPNIPSVDSIATVNAVTDSEPDGLKPELQTQTQTRPMLSKLKQLLLKLGLLPEDAAEDEATIEPALGELETSYNAMKAKLGELETAKKKADDDKAAAEATTTASNAAHESTITALNAELVKLRTQRAEMAADALVASGHITAAEREATVTTLNAETFDAELSKLQAKTPAVKTKGLNLGDKRQGITTTNAARDHIANWCAAKGGDYTTAFNASKTAPECKEAWAVLDAADKQRKAASA